MKKPLIIAFALLGLAAIPACSSSSDNNGGSSNCVPTSDFGNASAACKSCVESSCSSEYSALCSAGCTSSNASSSACTQAAQNVGNCILSKCSSQCEDSSSAGGSSNNGTAGTTSTSGGTSNASGGSDSTAGGTDNTSGGTGNSAGSGSSTAGTGGVGTPTTASCMELETCCNTFTSDDVKGPCLQAAGFNNDGPCANLLKQYQNGGSCTGKGGTDGNHFVCYHADMGICTRTFAPANYIDMYKMGCVSGGGETHDSCPTDHLVGCCTIGPAASASESCYYDSLSPAPTADDCTQTTGTWSTTP